MKNFIFVFLSTVLLSISSTIACGYHLENTSLDSLLKQFPNRDILYSSDNPDHRGWSKYLTTSLFHTRQIVLTFDDGPHPINTPRLLDLLKKYKVKATFFAVSTLVEKYQDIAKRIVSEGHTLASHDYKHDNSNNESEGEYEQGLEKSILTIKALNNQNEMYYRFPYGAYGRHKNYHHFNSIKNVSEKLFNENCINFAFWDIDTSDWVQDMLATDIIQNIHSHLDGGQAYRFERKEDGQFYKLSYYIDRPVGGGVILMHDIHKRTIDAMEIFLKSYKEKNIEIIELKDVTEFEYGSRECKLL